MALNMTIFNGSGSTDNEVEQAALEVPEYTSYALLCVYLLSIPVVIVPASLAIIIIVKDKRLQSNNILLINLLLTDVDMAVVWCTNGLLTLLYLIGVSVGVDCNLMLISFMLFVLGNKLMFIPMCVDRFIHIAYPFSYKRMVTTKAVKATIITLWMAAIVISISLHINEPLDYIPSVGICKPAQANIPGTLIMLLCFIISIVLITNKYIATCARGPSSQKFFPQCQEKCCPRMKIN